MKDKNNVTSTASKNVEVFYTESTSSDVLTTCPYMKFAKVKDVKTPSRGTSASAGIDFFIPNDYVTKTISPGESILIPSGIKANVPPGYALIAFNKSGIATKKKLYVGACVVDEDYCGEIHIHVTNVSNFQTVISPGEKIVQFILIPVLYAVPVEVKESELFESQTERGEKGFGEGTGAF